VAGLSNELNAKASVAEIGIVRRRASPAAILTGNRRLGTHVPSE
jgi:hypothetical protein